MPKRVWFRKSTHVQKIQWMLKHQSEWDGFAINDSRWQGLVEKMKKDGLYAESTYWKDVQIWNLVVETRKLRRMNSTRSKK